MANELDAYKSEQQKLLEAQKARAQESAAINHHKLLKYLEQSSASKGYSVGMTESAKIAAANQYSQDVAAADAAYNQGVADLNNYVRDQQKAERDENFNNIMTTIDSKTWNTTADLENYLYGEVGADGKRSGGVADGLSDFQKKEIENRLNFYKNNPDQQAADNAYNNQKNLTVSQGKDTDVGGHLSDTNAGNNFTINGYKVELGDAAAEGVVPADKIANVADKVPFAYNGAIYIKINGTVYAVRGRGGKLDSDGYKNALEYLTKPKTDAGSTNGNGINPPSNRDGDISATFGVKTGTKY